ncbi:MAG: hypothetical protein KR126chlam3_00415 [Chlamydiae bacterium]|nr:hypothetical protein [Chlamydiota bacterium]
MIALGAGFFIYWNTANHYNEQAHLADLRAAEIGQEVTKAQPSTGTDPVEFNPSET